MSPSVPTIVAGLVRCWVRLYTSGLEPDLRNARRMEIRSDLWEQQREATASGTYAGRLAWDLCCRLIAGIPADLTWRLQAAGLERHAGGLMLAGLATIGLRLAFLGPGVPDFDAPAQDIATFFRERSLQMAVGHALIWLSAALFMAFAARLQSTLGNTREALGWLPGLIHISGVAAGLMLCLAFGLTAIAAFYAAPGLNRQAVQTLYPLAGFTFHILMSAAIVVFLATSAAAGRRAALLPPRHVAAGIGLAFLFLLEAAGGPTVFLLPQALFLVWIVTVGGTLDEVSRTIR